MFSCEEEEEEELALLVAAGVALAASQGPLSSPPASLGLLSGSEGCSEDECVEHEGILSEASQSSASSVVGELSMSSDCGTTPDLLCGSADEQEGSVSDESPDLFCGVEAEFEEEHGERQWLVGQNCGQWISRQAPLMEQGRVLIVNLCFNLQALPVWLVTAACEARSVQAARETSPFKLAAHLLGLSASFLRRVFAESRGTGNMWTPWPRGTTAAPLVEEAPVGTAPHVGEETPPHRGGRQTPFRNLVRLALANAAEGRSWRSYVRDAVRYQLAGASVPNAYLTRPFCVQVVGLGALCLMEQDALDFNAVLPGWAVRTQTRARQTHARNCEVQHLNPKPLNPKPSTP